MENENPKKRTLPSLEFLGAAAILLLTVLVSAVAMAPSVADPDLWGHVQFGREVLQKGAIPETNSYSFTSNDFRWINHENLSEIAMATTVDRFGPQGLLWGKLLLSLFVIGSIIIYNLRRGVSLVATCMLTILVAWNLGYHWSFRPQLSSFIFFTLMVMLLNWSFSGWKDRWHFRWFGPRFLTRDELHDEINYSWLHARLLWIAPLLFFLWTNSHGGFVAGICVFSAYLGLRAIEAVSTYWPKGWGYAQRMGLMIAVALLATLLNPYSYRLPMWLIESLGQPRPEIMDWSSHQLWSLVGFKLWALVAVVIASIAFSKKSLDFTQTILLGLTLWQAVSHFRHVPFFAILAGFWIGPHLQSVLVRFSKPQNEAKSETSPRIQIAIATVMLAVTMLIGYQLKDRLTDLKVKRDEFPVDAVQFMSDHELRGKLVVTYDWAQYAIATFGVVENLEPGQVLTQVAFDGRFRTCYPQEIVDMHFDLLFGEHSPRHRSPNSGPIDPTKVLKHGTPDLVLIRRKGERSQAVMATQTDQWVKLYQDGLSQLWGRRTKYDNPDNSTYLPESERKILSEMPTGYVNWPALPNKSRGSNATAVNQQANILPGA